MSYRPQVGDPIRFNRPHRGYDTTAIYTVSEVDASDSTLKATHPTTRQQGPWVSWSDVDPTAVIGWDYLQRHLPSDALKLLEAFEGVQRLRLRDDVKDAILVQLPDLAQRILLTVKDMEGRDRLDEVPSDPLLAELDAFVQDTLDAPLNQSAGADTPSPEGPTGEPESARRGSQQRTQERKGRS